MSLRKEGVLGAFSQTTLRITVDYDQSVEVMREAGKYKDADIDITTEHFLPQRSGIVKLKAILALFGRPLESEEILVELKKAHLRAGILAELLAVGAQHPGAQRKYAIIALGSVWVASDDRRNGPLVPDLWSLGPDRRLDLDWFDFPWDGSYRFLAFRE
jgi:hypothetical protein